MWRWNHCELATFLFLPPQKQPTYECTKDLVSVKMPAVSDGTPSGGSGGKMTLEKEGSRMFVKNTKLCFLDIAFTPIYDSRRRE